jgi:cytidylate kinase
MGGGIAFAVAGRLGYQCIGSEMLAEAAHQHGLTAERLTRLGEAKPSLLDRLDAETQMYVAVMQSAVYEAALEDDVVLLGRGGQWLLRGIAHVLRVRVVAPFEVRVGRLAERLTTETGRSPALAAAHDAAADLVRRDDRDKVGRMRYLYDRDIDDPELYDLFVNTERLSVESSAEILALAVQRLAPGPIGDGRARLVDRALAARVRVALLSDERTRGYRHPNIDAEAGVVSIATMGPVGPVETVAEGVAGVRIVQATEIPVLPPMPIP